MVDTSDSKSDAAMRGGSSPPTGTTKLPYFQGFPFLSFIRVTLWVTINLTLCI
jgi:hypothetical protein